MDFRNAVVIMTSNLGSQYYGEGPLGEEGFESIRRRILEEVRIFFRPEFINRLDEIVVFRNLGIDEIKQIVRIQVEMLAKRLAERRIRLELTEAALAEIATTGYDPVYGARPLKRVIQRELMNPLAQRLLAGEFLDGQTVRADYADGSWRFESVASPD